MTRAPDQDMSKMQATPPDATPLPGGARYVDAFVVDINGNMLGKRMPAGDWAGMQKSGVQFSAAAVVLDARGMSQGPAGIGGEDGDPDGIGRPLPWSVAPVNWARENTAQCLLDMRDAATNEPLWFDPRAVLAGVIDRCAADGIRPVVACELEFYLLDPRRTPDGGIQPPIHSRTGAPQRMATNLNIQQVEDYGDVLGAIVDACTAQGLRTGTVVAEYGLGQFEINLLHTADPLRAADEAALMRRVVKGVTRAHGLEATFMAKPYPDQAGSGLHIHMSLADEDGSNRFAAENGETLLHSAIAGLRAFHSDSFAFFGPNFGSYRRFAPGPYVPLRPTWGYNSRSVSFRIPAGDQRQRRVEHRVAGADASPHLVMAALLAAAHHGIVNKLPLGPNEPECTAWTAPENLPVALDRLCRSTLIPDYIPARFLNLYRELKLKEFADLFAAVTPAEYDFYL